MDAITFAFFWMFAGAAVLTLTLAWCIKKDDATPIRKTIGELLQAFGEALAADPKENLKK